MYEDDINSWARRKVAKMMKSNNEELLQYIIVNKDIPLSTGKIAAHAAHASIIMTLAEQGTERFKDWYDDGNMQRKIILKAKEKDLEKLEKEYYSVRDRGFYETEEGTLVAVSLGIMTREEAKPIVKRFQLL